MRLPIGIVGPRSRRSWATRRAQSSSENPEFLVHEAHPGRQLLKSASAIPGAVDQDALQSLRGAARMSELSSIRDDVGERGSSVRSAASRAKLALDEARRGSPTAVTRRQQDLLALWRRP